MRLFNFLKKDNKKRNISDYLKNLKKDEMVFVQEVKFKKLYEIITDVILLQIELSKYTIEKKSKELGFNLLDTNIAYGYYYGFCDFMIQMGPYKDGMKEIFFLWANVTKTVTKVSDPVTDFIDYFDKINSELIKDTKSGFYLGCKSGGQDAMDWVKEKSNPMGLTMILEKIKKNELEK